jgi:D-alanyl-D-alanine carboxypeptidase/D-alanyl-D-alanine-endopeptidase (penicillin-binding protein 4)
MTIPRMKNLIAAISLFFSGCAVLAPHRPPSDPVDRLRYDIDAVLADSIFIPARASIKVVSLGTGQVLYEKDSKVLMRPASNTKLITSATALHVLGTSYQFKTSVFVDSQQPNGVVNGNLYIKGYGDPDLKSSDLDSLTSQLKSMGITRITGDIVADNSFFDDLYWGNGWMWDDEPEADEMFISALSINKNCVKVNVIPAVTDNDSSIVTIDPTTSYVSVLKNIRTVRDSSRNPLKISRLFKDRLNAITVDGEIQIGSKPRQQGVSVWKPELYTAHLLKESLQRSGILPLGQPSSGFTPWKAVEIVQRLWPLDSVIVTMNKSSDNLSAENLLKTIAVFRGGIPGSARNGIYAVNEFLSSCGIDTTRLQIVDGSGVSHYNLITADQLVQLLVSISKRPEMFPRFYASLPIAGVDGTLQDRMKTSSAAGNLRAKTGTINGVSTLSGYVQSRDGEMIAFSMMMQNFVIPAVSYRSAQDKIGELLASFSRRQGRTAPQ